MIGPDEAGEENSPDRCFVYNDTDVTAKNGAQRSSKNLLA